MIPWRSAGSAGIMTQNFKELMKMLQIYSDQRFHQRD